MRDHIRAACISAVSVYCLRLVSSPSTTSHLCTKDAVMDFPVFVIDPGVCTEGDDDAIFHYKAFCCCEEISPVSAEPFEDMHPNSVWSNPSARVTRKHLCPFD